MQCALLEIESSLSKAAAAAGVWGTPHSVHECDPQSHNVHECNPQAHPCEANYRLFGLFAGCWVLICTRRRPKVALTQPPTVELCRRPILHKGRRQHTYAPQQLSDQGLCVLQSHRTHAFPDICTALPRTTHDSHTPNTVSRVLACEPWTTRVTMHPT
jgi:hypothetical protein